MWLDIKRFTNFTSAYFFAKCHDRELFAKIRFLPLVRGMVPFHSLHKIHAIGKDLKTDSFAVFESSRFVTTEYTTSGRTGFALPICLSISCHPSLVSNSARYLNFSICCSALPPTCSIHSLMFLERHNTSGLSVLIFIPAWSHAQKPIECMLKALLWRC